MLDTQVWTYSGNVKYFNTTGATGATFGLWDISRIKKTGYTATRNWHVGSKNNSVIILDNTVFANGQALAKAAGKDLSNGDAVIDIYPEFTANTYTITYDANGGALHVMDETIAKNNNGTATAKVQYDTNRYYALGIMPTRQGYTFKGFYDAPSGGIQVLKPYNPANCLSVASKYYNENNIWKYTGNVTLYAQWEYNSVSVKVPQVLIGDHTGKSQFRVKCDDFKAGSIKITVPDNFLYKQEGKADVTALITSKSGNNIITSTNKVCVYDITTKRGLSAGCWNGSFNIGLTLTKE